jgi:hypothetical protein
LLVRPAESTIDTCPAQLCLPHNLGHGHSINSQSLNLFY